jgi:hypothetical protein
MGIWIAEVSVGSRDGAILIDSVTETAFGPLFDSGETAEGFLAWCKRIGLEQLRERAFKASGVREDIHDVRQLNPEALAQLVQEYLTAAGLLVGGRRVDFLDVEGDMCRDCGLIETHVPGCPNVAGVSR